MSDLSTIAESRASYVERAKAKKAELGDRPWPLTADDADELLWAWTVTRFEASSLRKRNIIVRALTDLKRLEAEATA